MVYVPTSRFSSRRDEGAALAGMLLRDLRSAVPVLPLVLLATATAIHAWCYPRQIIVTNR